MEALSAIRNGYVASQNVELTCMRPAQLKNKHEIYRDEINSLQIQLSRTQAGPGRAVKEQEERYSPNHVQGINLISVRCSEENNTLLSLHCYGSLVNL